MILSLVGRLPSSDLPPALLTDEEISRVAAAGLGALFHHLNQQGHIHCSESAGGVLESADLTSRVLSSNARRSAVTVLDELGQQDIHPILLKGMDVAQRYYPEAHWRVMGDIDLLLPADAREEAVSCLKQRGFHNPTDDPDSDWDKHHHAVPLYSDELKIWVELHHKLITDQSPFDAEPALAQDAVLSDLSPGILEGREVRYLAPERTLLFTILHWYFDLIDRWGSPGLQRAAVDCFFLNMAGVTFSQLPDLSPQAKRAGGLMAQMIATEKSARSVDSSCPMPMGGGIERALAKLAGFRVDSSGFKQEVTGLMFRQALSASGPVSLRLATALGALGPLSRAIRQRL
ncbi:MAG: nucleotidyltransferase family protein [Lysobacterales bacterium]